MCVYVYFLYYYKKFNSVIFFMFIQIMPLQISQFLHAYIFFIFNYILFLIFIFYIIIFRITHNNFQNIIHYMCIYSSIRFFNSISNINFRRECRVATPQCRAQDDQIAKNLWNQTCQLLHLECDEDFAKFLKTVSRQIVE